MKLIALIKTIISTPTIIFSLLAFICFSALAAAFTSEAFLGLEPCVLCIYQRYPFALGIIIGLAGLAMRNKLNKLRVLLGLGAINFLANSGIALYHTGVEQKWWASAVDGCSVPLFFDDTSEQSILENLLSAPMGSCSEIPWQDPVLGLSMANYNVILCLGLCVFCALSAVMIKSHQEPSKNQEQA